MHTNKFFKPKEFDCIGYIHSSMGNSDLSKIVFQIDNSVRFEKNETFWNVARSAKYNFFPFCDSFFLTL